MTKDEIKLSWKILCRTLIATNGNEKGDSIVIRHIRNALAEKWALKNEHTANLTFYIDPNTSGYYLAMGEWLNYYNHTNQEKGASVTRYKINEAEALRMGLMWKPPLTSSAYFFGTMEQYPDKLITRYTEYEISKDNPALDVIDFSVSYTDDQLSAESIDLDVKKLKEKSSLGGVNKINLGVTVDEFFRQFDWDTKDGIEMVFFVQSFSADECARMPDNKFIPLGQCSLDQVDVAVYLSDNLSTTKLLASVDIDSMELTVQNQPLEVKNQSVTLKPKPPEGTPGQHDNKLDLKYMLETIIPPGSLTTDIEKADIIISDRSLDREGVRVINPEKDINELLEMLMV